MESVHASRRSIGRTLVVIVAMSPGTVFAQASRAASLPLERCTIPGVEGEARCGVHYVSEDRRSGTGRKIPLFVGVLPALEAPAAPDPLFVLAGGPGQAASEMGQF